MKNCIILTSLAFLVLTALPLGLLRAAPKEASDESLAAEETLESAKNDEAAINVFLSGDKKTVSLSLFEYTCGSVAAEMPITYEDEALKAQAVACITNALRLKNTGGFDVDGADISDDTSTHQGYMSLNERKEKWGDSFEKYEEKLEKAVKAVEGKALYYDGKLCIAAFCHFDGHYRNRRKRVGQRRAVSCKRKKQRRRSFAVIQRYCTVFAFADKRMFRKARLKNRRFK